jgi:hypothetical protein
MEHDVHARRLSTEKRARPDHFSTYVPRELVRRLKVVATILDMPLWAVVTDALEDHLDSFQKQYGRLPAMDDRTTPERGR